MAKWLKTKAEISRTYCSECGRDALFNGYMFVETPYCPYCGRVMETADTDKKALLNRVTVDCYEVPRGKWQNLFAEFLDKHGFDWYGYYCQSNTFTEYFSNDTFEIIPFQWEETELAEKEYNFLYKPTGLKIQWYKYPLRSAFANQNISYNNWEEIIKDCAKSMENKND